MPDHIDPFRIYLLAGLILHKAVWEILKRRSGQGGSTKPRTSLFRLAVKSVKIAILAGIIAQTLLPEILPIAAGASGLRMAGLAVFTVGLATAIVARLQLGDNWADIESPERASGQALVAKGIYRHVRHPIYAADLVLLLGLEMALNSWLVLGVLLLAPVVLRQAIREERKLAATLAGYDEYCRRTKRFVPFVV